MYAKDSLSHYFRIPHGRFDHYETLKSIEMDKFRIIPYVSPNGGNVLT